MTEKNKKGRKGEERCVSKKKCEKTEGFRKQKTWWAGDQNVMLKN